MAEPTKNIAVVGSGIAGLGAAWALSRRHDVTLFDRELRLGGHSRTIDVVMGERLVPVDTGFIVYNEKNYPNLTRLFEVLDVPTEPSDMSFAVSRPDFEFAASVSAIARSPRLAWSRRTWNVVRGIARFRRLVDNHRVDDDRTLIEFLETNAFPRAFVEDYLLPLAAAVWSGAGSDAASMPVGTFLEFIGNHGLFDAARPQWRTVSGGSREYVERIAKAIPKVRTGTPIHRVRRSGDGIELSTSEGIERFDAVVMAAHAPVTVDLLGATATPAEREILGAFHYAPNRAVVHRDPTLMPRRRSAWSSWNSIGNASAESTTPATVTYWMNRLQNLDRRHDVFVTLNPDRMPEGVIDEAVFAHPQFTPETDRAQRRLPEIQGADRIWYAGAWTGYGFHEDGLQSGLTVAAALDASVEWHDTIVPASSAARNASPREPR